MSTGRISKYDASASAVKSTSWQCGLYLRLSREDGDKLESDSIANQRKIIDRYLEKNPDINIFDVYTDDGYTGANFDRPDMQRLLGDIKSRKVNCLIVKDLSRFGRNYIESGKYIEVVFPLLKLRFIAINDRIDSFKNPSSVNNSTVSFKNVMNDEYGRDISNKIKSVFNMKRKKGQYIGSFALYGYLKDPNDRHKLVVDPEASETVRLIYKMFVDGTSVYNICIKLKEMGVANPTEYKKSKGLSVNRKCFEFNSGGWSTQTVRRMLKNEMYLGHLVQKQYENVNHKIRKSVAVPKDRQIVVKDNHEPIIDAETFNKVQMRSKRDTWQEKGITNSECDTSNDRLLVGYIKCGDCGRAMQRAGYAKGKNNFFYFICSTYLQWKQCSRHATRITNLTQAVLTIVQKYVEMAIEMDSLLDAINKLPTDSFALTRYKKENKAKEIEQERLVKFLNGLYLDFKEELITKEQYLHFKSDYETKIEATNIAIAALNTEISNMSGQTGYSNSFIDNFKKHKNITVLTKEVVAELIEMIYVEKNGGIRIVFNFQDSFNRAVEILEANNKHIGIDRVDTVVNI
jgi:DNA invertase Pin-like site-specific DNA recombinase